MNRAERRAQAQRIKAKFADLARARFSQGAELAADPGWVGRTAAMHCTCDCWMCTTPELTNRRPSFEKRTPTELFE